MTVTIKQLDKKIAAKRKAMSDCKKELYPSAAQPKPIDYDCPKCKSPKGQTCKAPSGHAVSNFPHKERTQLTEAADVAWGKKYTEWSNKHNKLNAELNQLLDDHRKLDYKLEKELEAKKFLDKFKGAKFSNAELILEIRDSSDISVVKSRNVVQLIPGDRIPNRDAVAMLSKKGVDVTMVQRDHSWYSPPWQMYPFVRY